MFKVVCFLFVVMSVGVRSQDTSGFGDFFNQAIQSVIGQWGNMNSSDIMQLFINYQNNPLHQVWNGLSDHCSSNFQCGPDACCLKPVITGKRAITDGSQVHYGSYCAKLRDLGDSCSVHDNHVHYYTSHCPCDHGLVCKPSAYVQLAPGLSVPVNSICKSA